MSADIDAVARCNGDARVNAQRRDDADRLVDRHRSVARRIEHDDLATRVGDGERGAEAALGRGERAGVGIVTKAGDEGARRGQRVQRGGEGNEQ